MDAGVFYLCLRVSRMTGVAAAECCRFIAPKPSIVRIVDIQGEVDAALPPAFIDLGP